MRVLSPVSSLVPRLARSPAKRQAGCAGACPVATYLGSLKPKGRRIMTTALNQFAALVTAGVITNGADLDWATVGFEHTAYARAEWARKYEPEGARVRLAGVKMTLKAAWRLGLLETERYLRAVDLDPIRGESLQKGRALSGDEMATLYEVCRADRSLVGLRDTAMFALFRTGMRAGELVAVEMRDYTAARGDEPATIAVRMGKGDKQRYAYLPAPYDALIGAWLDVRGRAPGPLLCSVLSGRVRLTALSEDSIYARCVIRARAAGLAHFTPHDQRRTTATDLYEAGAKLPEIRDVLGHASVQTTQKYLRNDREAAKRAAMARLALPPRKEN